ncbi:biotin synthase BioB [Corynebacterium anserum]|uniref:Biotin synthase n=1 Tax=Corynebacterium anserum TaxID=2684406 RepID=A0A7G7YPX7_9CORY|nr:biotin synthase BioB [Corynebacterium anserum]MBC2682201.1 biotin synthase BioB [Corynebacterium anserum]QNH96547.1 biotin synthase BioB [Corynebacterium anserum]
MSDILETARTKALDKGEGLTQEELLQVLHLPDSDLEEMADVAHQTRLKWCGPDVEVEGIISIKTGGCPEDCHFCSQSGLFESPVRAARLNIGDLVEAAKRTRKSGATEFCIVAAVKGPDHALLEQVGEAVEAINKEIEIDISCSLGTLTLEQAQQLKDMGVRRYNHNLETSRSFFPKVVTTHSWDERRETLDNVRRVGMEICSGGIIGMGESLEQRAEFAAQLAEIEPCEVPMNFLDPRPGTPFADRPLVPVGEGLRAVAMFRFAMPKTTLRFAGGRELSLGDDGTEKGLLGGINAIIAGNYLTTLGQAIEKDVDMLHRIDLPIKAL